MELKSLWAVLTHKRNKTLPNFYSSLEMPKYQKSNKFYLGYSKFEFFETKFRHIISGLVDNFWMSCQFFRIFHLCQKHISQLIQLSIVSSTTIINKLHIYLNKMQKTFKNWSWLVSCSSDYYFTVTNQKAKRCNFFNLKIKDNLTSVILVYLTSKARCYQH